MRNSHWSVKIKLLIMTAFTIFVLIACGGEKRQREFIIANSSSYEASLFRQNCAICHGAEANGKTVDGTEVPSLRYGEAVNKSEEDLYRQIFDGKKPMPSFKNQLTEEEIHKMTKFIMEDLQNRKEVKIKAD